EEQVTVLVQIAYVAIRDQTVLLHVGALFGVILIGEVGNIASTNVNFADLPGGKRPALFVQDMNHSVFYRTSNAPRLLQPLLGCDGSNQAGFRASVIFVQ